MGNRAKNIKNKPVVNQEKSLAEYKRLLNEAYRAIKNLKKKNSCLENDKRILIETLKKNGIPIPDMSVVSEEKANIEIEEDTLEEPHQRPKILDQINEEGMDSSLKKEYEDRIRDLRKDLLDCRDQ